MDRNALNNRLRDYAFSGRAQTGEIPYLYGLRDGQGGPEALDALGGSGGDLQRGGDLPSLVGGGGPSGPADTGLIGPGLAGDDVNALSGFLNSGFDGGRYDDGDGGRGGYGGPDIEGSRAQDPLSDLDRDILSALGNVPGFGLATGFTRAADFFGASGVLDDPNPVNAYGAPGTLGFKGYIDQRRAQELISRHRRNAQEIADGDRDTLGGYSIGAGAFDAPPGSFDDGYDSQEFGAPEPGPVSGGYDVGGYAVGGGLGYDGPTGSSFDGGGRDGGGRGSPDGGSGGHGGQAGEGAGSGNNAGGGRGDSPGYHDGGYVSEDLVPGETRGDVQATIQEGEHVITADAVEMFGQDFFDKINAIATMRP